MKAYIDRVPYLYYYLKHIAAVSIFSSALVWRLCFQALLVFWWALMGNCQCWRLSIFPRAWFGHSVGLLISCKLEGSLGLKHFFRCYVFWWFSLLFFFSFSSLVIWFSIYSVFRIRSTGPARLHYHESFYVGAVSTSIRFYAGN